MGERDGRVALLSAGAGETLALVDRGGGLDEVDGCGGGGGGACWGGGTDGGDCDCPAIKSASLLRWSLFRVLGALATSSAASGRSMPDLFVALWSLIIFIMRSCGLDSSSCRRLGGVSPPSRSSVT